MANFVPHRGKQTEFLRATEDNILFGGQRGGTKTFSLVWKDALMPRTWHYEYKKKKISTSEYLKLKRQNRAVHPVVDTVSIDYPEFRGILLRRTYPDIIKNIKNETEKLYPSLGAIWKEREHAYVFPSGAKIYLNHCLDERALRTYIGLNFHFIGIDEANQFPPDWIVRIATNLRTINPLLKPQLGLTSNPGDIGHSYLKKNYVDRCKRIPDGPKVYNKEFDVWYQNYRSAPAFIDEEGISWKFIPSSVFDNPSIIENDKKYVRMLKSLPPVLRAMWLEGNWDVAPGMYFDKWNILHHTIPQSQFKYGVSFDAFTHDLYRAYDYGTKAPFVCQFWAVDRDGNAVCFDEIVETGLSSSQQAKLINKYTMETYKLKNDDFVCDIADPAYWTKTSENEKGTLYSPADFYADQGIMLIKGNNDRKAGAKVVYDLLTIPDKGPPKLRYTDNCIDVIEKMPILTSDPRNPDDVDTRAYDHNYDTTRYFAMNIFGPAYSAKKKEKGWRDRWAEKSLQTQSAGSWLSA